MRTWVEYLLTAILKKSQMEAPEGRTIQVMVEATKIQRYMSNDLPTVIYKGIV